MKTLYTKGQKVAFIQLWSDANSHQPMRVTFKVVPALVYSCGAKRMILSDLEGNVFQGKTFAPRVSQWQSQEVIEFTTIEAAITRAQEISDAYRLAQIENTKHVIEVNKDKGYVGYIEAMQKTLDHLLANEAAVIL